MTQRERNKLKSIFDLTVSLNDDNYKYPYGSEMRKKLWLRTLKYFRDNNISFDEAYGSIASAVKNSITSIYGYVM